MAIYNAECLRLLAENTAKMSGGSYIQVKLKDILDPKPEETRTPEEIIEGIRKRL